MMIAVVYGASLPALVPLEQALACLHRERLHRVQRTVGPDAAQLAAGEDQREQNELQDKSK